MKRVLVDTGPLIATMSEDDRYHLVCVETARTIDQPLFSCWPVLTEAAWFLRGHPAFLRRLLLKVGSGELCLLRIEDTEVARILHIMERYANLHPQLADAALVYLAERERIDTIFTLDRRDFSVYRTSHNRPFRILPERPN